MSTITERRRAASLPSTLRVGLSRGGIEIRQFFRERDAVVFTFALPAFLLTLLGLIFNEPMAGAGVAVSQVFTASMIAYGTRATRTSCARSRPAPVDTS